MQFRKDIEGLRGVAVLAVIAAHAGVPFIAGGFIGVDVFFVISGYLIGGLLLEEQKRTGQIDLVGFYARRAARLLPALLLMLVLTWLFARTTLPTTLLALQATSGLWASLWGSNVFFAFQAVNYFDRGAEASLYLHTWSLAVEEQFYLVWPVILLCVQKLVRGDRAAMRKWIIGLILLSFGVAMIAGSYNGTAAYYLMPTRLWELAAGTAAYLASTSPKKSSSIPHDGWIFTGLLAVLIGFFLVPTETSMMFVWLLLPVVGTALLLAKPAFRFSFLLEFPLLRFLGRISYSAYLWHWPLLIFVKELNENAPVARAIAVALAIMFATISTLLIEEPVRRLRIRVSNRMVIAGEVVATLISSCMFLWGVRETENRIVADNTAESRIRALATLPDLYSKRCEAGLSSHNASVCVMSAPPIPVKRVVLVGDSVAAQWEPALTMIAKRRNWRLEVFTKSACPALDARFYYRAIRREFTECYAWRDDFVRKMHNLKPDIILIGSSAAAEITAEEWQQGVDSFIQRLHGAADNIVYINPTPLLPYNAMDCMLSANRSNVGKVVIPANCSVPLQTVRHDEITQAIGEAVRSKQQYGGVAFLDLNHLVCPQSKCDAWRNDLLIYRDQQHLTAKFVESKAVAIDLILQAVVLDSGPH